MSLDRKGKILKRKKKDLELDVNAMSNTASVSNILDFAASSSTNRLVNCYSYLMTFPNPNFVGHNQILGHSLKAFPDDWDGDLKRGYFEQFPYKSSMPKIITNIRNMNKSDPVTAFMNMKRQWILECYGMKLTGNQLKLMEHYKQLNDEVVECPKFFVDLAAKLDSDPDVYFESSYNWYYAGNGNLQRIQFECVDYFLHSEFNTTYLSQFECSDSKVTINPEPAAKYSCEEGNNIFETIYSSQNIIALRTKYKVFILKIITTDDKPDIEKIETMEFELPLTSITFDRYHKNILYVTSIDDKLTIVNLDRMKRRSVKLSNEFNSHLNNWGMVLNADRVTYTHVSSKSITLYDKRTNASFRTWNDVRNKADCVHCNDITSAKQYEESPFLHLGTEHHLYLMDLRFVHKSQPKVVHRWTHGMRCPPTYISNCNFETDKELICLSSQWCEDICVIPSYTDKLTTDSERCGVSIPYRPPSVLSALSEERQRLLPFDYYNPIEKRIASSITGLMVLEQNENYVILMQNSLGDISCHTLCPEHMYFDNPGNFIYEWSKEYKETEKEFIEVSTIVNIAIVWNNLKYVSDKCKLFERNWMPQTVSKFSEEEIFDTFKNKLDSGLLDIWVNEDSDKNLYNNKKTAEEESDDETFHSDGSDKV